MARKKLNSIEKALIGYDISQQNFLKFKERIRAKDTELVDTETDRLKEHGKVKKIESVNTKEVSQTKNNKIMLSSKCTVCNGKMLRFINKRPTDYLANSESEFP